VTQNVHVDALPAKADIVIAIDSTDTMRFVVDRAKAEASQLVQEVQGLIPGARFALMDFRDYNFPAGSAAAAPSQCSPPPDPANGTYPCALRTDGFTADAAAVQAAINGVTTGTGGSPGQPPDVPTAGPEAYNRILSEAIAEPKLAAGYDPKAQHFLVVLGDEVGRDTSRPARDARFGACPTSSLIDPGRNGVPEGGAGDDLTTESVIDRLSEAKQTLLMLSYSGSPDTLTCYQQLARPTGGDGFAGGNPAQVRDRIVSAIQTASAHVNQVQLVPQAAACPVAPTFSPATIGPLDAPADLPVTATFTVRPDGATHSCEVAVVADGGERGARATFQVKAPPAPGTAANGPPAEPAVEPAGDMVAQTVAGVI
jgi:hypothetical protein